MEVRKIVGGFMNLSSFRFRQRFVTIVAVASVVTASAFLVTGTSGAASQTGLQRAQAVVAKFGSIPTSIGITAKLKRVPPKGIKVAFMACPQSSCIALSDAFIAAADALHWNPTTVTYNSADPGAAVQSAINGGYKYIASSSIALSQITPQVAEMKAKHIGWFESYEADTPGFASNGLYGQASDPAAAAKEGQLMADWMIVDSSSNANALFVSLPIYPVLVSQGTAAQSELAKNCPTCTIQTLGISVAQYIAGQIPSLIVAYLQTHPSINYLYFSFAGLDPGVQAALTAAGLTTQVKVIGTQGTAQEMQAIQSGTNAAWSVLPENYIAWTLVDWMARLSVGQLRKADLTTGNGNAMYLADSTALATQTLGYQDLNNPVGVWGGPVGYQTAFEKLWGVKK